MFFINSLEFCRDDCLYPFVFLVKIFQLTKSGYPSGSVGRAESFFSQLLSHCVSKEVFQADSFAGGRRFRFPEQPIRNFYSCLHLPIIMD